MLRALVLMVPVVPVALVVGACSVVSLGVMRPWWLSSRGFGSWVWRRLVALGCLVWGLAGWGSWPRPA